MKKTAKIFAVAMVCMLAVTVFVACGGDQKPCLDYDTVVKNLTDEGYVVANGKDDEVASSAAASSVANFICLEKSDMAAFIQASLPKADQNTAPDLISMAWSKSEDGAKNAAELLEVSFQTAKELLEHNKSQMTDEEYKIAKTYYDNLKIGYEGNVVWYGTVDAINATK